MNARQVIEKLYDLYGQGHIDEALADCDESFRFHWVAEPGLVRHTANGLDRLGMRDRLVGLHDTFEYITYRPTMIVAEGENVAAQLEIVLRHKETDRTMHMAVADFWTVRDGKVFKLVEYYDTALVLSVVGAPEES